MAKVVRYEFMGSWLIFWILFISGLGLPFAILYLLDRDFATGNGSGRRRSVRKDLPICTLTQ